MECWWPTAMLGKSSRLIERTTPRRHKATYSIGLRRFHNRRERSIAKLAMDLPDIVHHDEALGFVLRHLRSTRGYSVQSTFHGAVRLRPLMGVLHAMSAPVPEFIWRMAAYTI